MISFSTKPRSARSRAGSRSAQGHEPSRWPAHNVGLAGLAAALEARAARDGLAGRDDEVADLERLVEARVFRPSWHDSSMDLMRGLDVTEGVPGDTLPDDLQDSLFSGLD
jgi:hypothetical protein